MRATALSTGGGPIIVGVSVRIHDALGFFDRVATNDACVLVDRTIWAGRKSVAGGLCVQSRLVDRLIFPINRPGVRGTFFRDHFLCRVRGALARIERAMLRVVRGANGSPAFFERGCDVPSSLRLKPPRVPREQRLMPVAKPARAKRTRIEGRTTLNFVKSQLLFKLRGGINKMTK